MSLAALARGVLAILCIHLSAWAQPSVPAGVGYVGWWLPSGWKSVQNTPLKRLFFFEIPIESTGNLGDRHGWPEQWADLQTHALSRGIPLDVTVTLMDAQTFHRVFSNGRAIERLLTQITELASHPAVAGVQLDVEVYEDLRPSDIDAFRQFVLRLSASLQQLQPPRQTSAFLPFQSTSRLYDRATLAILDHVVVQGYDSHWLESKNAGPIAPLDGPYALTWKKALAYTDDLGIPRSKQYLGYPLYGYEWRVRDGNRVRAPTVGKGAITTFSPLPTDGSAQPSPSPAIDITARVAQFGSAFDPVSASSQYRLKGPDGHWYEGWYEDWWSINRKRSFAADNQLAGLAFFLLGYDSGILVQHFFRNSSNDAKSDPPQ